MRRASSEAYVCHVKRLFISITNYRTIRSSTHSRAGFPQFASLALSAALICLFARSLTRSQVLGKVVHAYDLNASISQFQPAVRSTNHTVKKRVFFAQKKIGNELLIHQARFHTISNCLHHSSFFQFHTGNFPLNTNHFHEKNNELLKIVRTRL